jgi:hypothetical protein
MHVADFANTHFYSRPVLSGSDAAGMTARILLLPFSVLRVLSRTAW